MGEHAVVYGHPALIAAVDLRLRARIAATMPAAGGARNETVEIVLPQLEHRETVAWSEILAHADASRRQWEGYAAQPGRHTFRKLRGTDPAHLVKVALGEAASHLGEAGGPPCRVEVDSDLPLGSGFGSSAAVAVAVTAAYLAFRDTVPEPTTVERLALEVERRQHGSPSGVDGATVLYGGIRWAERDASGNLVTRPVVARSRLLERLAVYDTGTPAESTGTVVAAVRSRLDREPERYRQVLAHMAATTERFRAVLLEEEEDPEEVVGLIRDYEGCLEELGVVPAAIRQLVRRIEEAGGAAKISGAGALTCGPKASGSSGGAGSLLVYHPSAREVGSWGFLAPYRRYPVALGAPGLSMGGNG